MKILILDDDKNLLESLKRILDRHNHEVDCSDNAKQAVNMVNTGNYDFVLVDYKMPHNDGIWFMENADMPKQTKTLLITAYADRAMINRMFELGASGYLIKPFDEKEILRHMNFYSK
ncbi:response regulator [Verrucomicrobiota bacterium]